MDIIILKSFLYIILCLSLLITFCSLIYYVGRKHGYNRGYRMGKADGKIEGYQKYRSIMSGKSKKSAN